MKLVALIGLLLSLFIAIASVLTIRSLQSTNPQETQAKPKTIVVASEPIKYGERLQSTKLKTVDWFAETMPSGAVTSIADVNITDDGPYLLANVASGSPILKTQLTLPGQKPGLSSLLAPGAVAVTVPVNTITGVAGFVLPDERVDIISTRTIKDKKVNDIILEDVRVLAVDRNLESDAGKPVQAKSVTFEVPRDDAQKLVLATQVGEIFLTLRSVNRGAKQALRRYTDTDLNGAESSSPLSTGNSSAETDQNPNQNTKDENQLGDVAQKQFLSSENQSTVDIRVFRNFVEQKFVVPR